MSVSPFGGFGDAMFFIVPVLIGIVFIVVIGLIIVSVVKGARQWKRNNDSPVLTVEAMVVAKRADVSEYRNNTAADNMSYSSSTTYYVTFEVASGDRMEFQVRDAEYGMLAERDAGRLTFQGTRYQGFARSRQ